MENITFIVPVKIDSSYRLSNFHWVINYLSRIKVNYIIAEHDKERHVKTDVFLEQKKPFFHKTKLLNLAINQVKTKFVAIYDCDIFIPKQQLETGYDLLYNYDFLFPYDGTFLNVLNNYPINNEDEKEIYNYPLKPLHRNSTGGCFMANLEKLLEVGCYNENFISWGFEDDEIILRIKKLGFNVIRSYGKCYHFDHSRSMNSSDLNPYYQSNKNEYEKIKEMPVDLLKKYILNNFTL